MVIVRLMADWSISRCVTRRMGLRQASMRMSCEARYFSRSARRSAGKFAKIILLATVSIVTPPDAIVFASGRIRILDMVRVGLALNFIGIIVATTIFYLFGRLVFGLE